MTDAIDPQPSQFGRGPLREKTNFRQSPSLTIAVVVNVARRFAGAAQLNGILARRRLLFGSGLRLRRLSLMLVTSRT